MTRGHTIHVCKDTTEDERQKTLQSRGEARKMAAMMFKCAEEDRAFVGKCIWFPHFLDSGAFRTTIPQKLFKKLSDRGVSLKENKLDEPMQIYQAVARNTCIAKSSTHLTMRLHTRVGPVLLRGLRILVIL